MGDINKEKIKQKINRFKWISLLRDSPPGVKNDLLSLYMVCRNIDYPFTVDITVHIRLLSSSFMSSILHVGFLLMHFVCFFSLTPTPLWSQCDCSNFSSPTKIKKKTTLPNVPIRHWRIVSLSAKFPVYYSLYT